MSLSLPKSSLQSAFLTMNEPVSFTCGGATGVRGEGKRWKVLHSPSGVVTHHLAVWPWVSHITKRCYFCFWCVWWMCVFGYVYGVCYMCMIDVYVYDVCMWCVYTCVWCVYVCVCVCLCMWYTYKSVFHTHTRLDRVTEHLDHSVLTTGDRVSHWRCLV